MAAFEMASSGPPCAAVALNLANHAKTRTPWASRSACPRRRTLTCVYFRNITSRVRMAAHARAQYCFLLPPAVRPSFGAPPRRSRCTRMSSGRTMEPRRGGGSRMAGRGRGEDAPLLARQSTLTWLQIVRFCRPYIVPPDREHRVLAVVSLCAVVLGKVISLAPPLAMSYAVDLIAEGKGGVEGPLWALFLFFAARAAGLGLSIVQRMANSYVSADARRRFGVDLYEHLISLSLSYHLKQRSGEVMRIMNRSSTSVTVLMNVFLFTLIPTLFETVLVAAVFFKLGQPSVAFVVLVSVVVYFAFTISVTAWRTALRRTLNEADNQLADQTFETLSNLESVKVFQKDEQEVEEYRTRSLVYRDASVQVIASLELLNSGQGLIRLLGLCAGLCIAAYGTVYGNPRVSPGTFVSINLFIMQLFEPLAWLGTTFRQVTAALTDLEKAMDMLNEVPTITDAQDAIDLPMDEHLKGGFVEFRNVYFRYDESKGSVSGLKNINFVLKPGQTLAFVGETGSGKTSIIRVLLRLYDTNRGNILVNGHDIQDITQKSLRQRIGVVPQEPTLFNESVRHNIAYGSLRVPSDVQIYEAAGAAALTDFISKQPQKLDTIVGEHGVRLSGGERARVGLARCLIKRPSILLLDEATAALDSKTEQQVRHNISELCKGRTTIIVAHRLSTIRHADEIALVSNGSIIERGKHDELLALGGEYAELWRIQTENALGGPGSVPQSSSSDDGGIASA